MYINNRVLSLTKNNLSLRNEKVAYRTKILMPPFLKMRVSGVV